MAESSHFPSNIFQWLWRRFGFSDYMMEAFHLLVKEFARDV